MYFVVYTNTDTSTDTNTDANMDTNTDTNTNKDKDIILKSVEKTGRLVVVDPAHKSCSVASEIN